MLIKLILKLFRKYKATGFIPELQDDRDFEIGGWFDIGSYVPKNKRHLIPVLAVRDQDGQRTCVTESACTQKENHEGLQLSAQMLAAYLRSTGEMNGRGTSLSAVQNAIRKVGVCRKELTDNRYHVAWEQFSRPEQLTREVLQDAVIHKSESFYKTNSLDQVLRELDRNNIGQTASVWKSSLYNLRAPYFIKYDAAGYIDYHAYAIVGYDLDYLGRKVLIVANSFGSSWGDQGYCYIDFNEFAKLLEWGVYFQSDLPKDKLGWISIHQQQAVKELNGPKIYLIEQGAKRHIPDMPMLHLLGKLTSFIEDKDNMLPEITEGEPISIKDIPADRLAEVREQVRLLRDAEFLKEEYKDYFPDLFLT